MGFRYTQYIPAELREQFNVYSVSGEDNRCLYNAVSVALHGDVSRSARLKLLCAANGAARKHTLIDYVSIR